METVPENSIPGLSDSIAKIREDGKSGVENLTEECVSTMADVTRLLMKVMLDTAGPEVLVVTKVRNLSLQEDGFVVLTPNQELEASSELLPINYGGFSKVLKKGDILFLGEYLFAGSQTSVWLEVFEVKGDDVGCVVKNSATLVGTMYTLHAAESHIDLPTLTEKDRVTFFSFLFVMPIIATWGVKNKIDFLSLSHARHVEDVRQARQFLSKLGDLNQTQIFAKIESVEKTALYRCNMAGKPAVLTRVVDSMTNNLRPTRAVATDVANAVLDGSDAIILGAETLHGLRPVETISTVSRICVEVICVCMR
ncbi:pyruvate kinase 2, cytosolic-like isoform X2 [Cucumis melo]|uniref:Pyruvate kinase n=1 Tax=Cucumis melo TaxID=3656 RepID=A0ABM3KL06_CUCME|nr:pyruvate kinase 2, cytosolic-like isoform X2 [Cucumis melo]